MTLPITILTHDFEGEPLTTFTWDGQPAWVAREIGRRLGYADRGKRLVSRIRREWVNEFSEGRDYVVLSGNDLAELKSVVSPGTPEVPSRTSGLMLLLEPGLHLVLSKTDKPIGVRLRRFLADRVLPQIVRDGRFGPERTVVKGSLVIVGCAPRPKPPLHVQREERLMLQARNRAGWVDLCDRRLKVASLHRMVDALGETLSDAARAAVEILAASIATGLPLGELLLPGPCSPVTVDLERLRRSMNEAA